MNSWLGKNKFCGLKMQVFFFLKEIESTQIARDGIDGSSHTNT